MGRLRVAKAVKPGGTNKRQIERVGNLYALQRSKPCISSTQTWNITIEIGKPYLRQPQIFSKHERTITFTAQQCTTGGSRNNPDVIRIVHSVEPHRHRLQSLSNHSRRFIGPCRERLTTSVLLHDSGYVRPCAVGQPSSQKDSNIHHHHLQSQHCTSQTAELPILHCSQWGIARPTPSCCRAHLRSIQEVFVVQCSGSTSCRRYITHKDMPARDARGVKFVQPWTP